MKRLAALAFALAAATANAYTPSSGFWWTPSESGTGIAIEIADKTLFLSAYTYDVQGRPTWYIASGNLTTSVVGGATYYNVFSGSLHTFVNGPAPGWAYTAPQAQFGAGGPVQIVFNLNDETKATLTWGGRSLPIERLDHYSGWGADRETQRMIGEWSVMVDLHNRGGDYAYYPFYGDVLIFDNIDTLPNPDVYEGCRPETSMIGRCTTSANTYHDAAGYYDASRDEHVIVVTDAVASGSTPALYWAYFLDMNMSDFEGVVELYFAGQTVGDGPFYPVRGFRSGSRSFVLNSGQGPASSDDAAKVAHGPVPSIGQQILSANGGKLPEGLTAAEVKARYGLDVTGLGDRIKALQAQLDAR